MMKSELRTQIFNEKKKKRRNFDQKFTDITLTKANLWKWNQILIFIKFKKFRTPIVLIFFPSKLDSKMQTRFN